MQIPSFFFSDFHVHTNISPCAREEMTLERIIEQAQRRDYTAIGLSDHAYADTYDRILELREQARAIDTGLEVYVGCEVDVLPDGSLGISDDRLAEFDYVLAAPTHQILGFDPDAADEAACREVLEQWFALTQSCCRHPVIDVIAHPLRGLDGGVEAEALINRVEGARLEGLLDRLREARLALELADSVQNTSSAQEGHRRFYGAAAQRGFLFSPGSDAHGLDRLGYQCHALWLYRDLGLSENCTWRPGRC